MKTIATTLLIAGSLACAAGIASAADAAENWSKMCASCHAKDGSGSTVMGKKNNDGDYTKADVQAKFTDAQAIAAITDGKDKMKSFKDKLTPDEVKALVAYIRGMKK